MPRTKIVVVDDDLNETVVMLDAGDVFVGRGDLIHAGASYDEHNVRLHFYILHNGCPLPDNTLSWSKLSSKNMLP